MFIDSKGRLEACEECRILQILQFDVPVASVDSWIDFFCNRLGDLEMEMVKFSGCFLQARR